MFKLKPEELKAHVLDKWAEQYKINQETNEYIPDNKNFVRPKYLNAGYSIDKLAIYRNIKAMPDYPTAEQIDNIIGNCEWTTDLCSFCGDRVALTSLLQSRNFGCEDWWVEGVATICEYCVSVATDTIKLG